jgi:16S rRNA processing protein RimM
LTSPSERTNTTAEGGEADPLIVIGRLSSPHGVRGWLHFRSFTETPETALGLKPWLLEIAKGGHHEVELEAHRVQGEGFLIKLAGVDDRNAAALQTGKHVHVPLSRLPQPEPDEVYWHDLEGMRVRNVAGDSLGAVVSLFDNGAHDVLVIRDGSAEGTQERLIPFVPEYVLEVDQDSRTLLVDWDPGWD